MNTKMKMRILSLLLCVVMLFSLLPANGLAALTQAAQESYRINITNKPGTTFVLEHDFTSDVCVLRKEIDSEGSGELSFNQSFSAISMMLLMFITTIWIPNIRIERTTRLPWTSTTLQLFMLKQVFVLTTTTSIFQTKFLTCLPHTVWMAKKSPVAVNGACLLITTISMLNFLKGPAEVSTYEKQFILIQCCI